MRANLPVTSTQPGRAAVIPQVSKKPMSGYVAFSPDRREDPLRMVGARCLLEPQRQRSMLSLSVRHDVVPLRPLFVRPRPFSKRTVTGRFGGRRSFAPRSLCIL